MAIPIGPAIAAGAALVGTGANAYSQGRLNRKTRKWNEKMHDITRQESLDDWAMMNEYNSPKAQMQRYRDAGLNPNLIYGQTNEAPVVRSADTPSWNPRSPTFEGIQTAGESYLNQFYDIQLKEAQIDNLEKQGSVLIQEAAMKAATIANTQASTERSKFDLEMSRQLSSVSLQTAEQNLRKMMAETKTTLDANERAQLLTANSLQQGVEAILTSRLNRAKTSDERANLQQALKNAKLDESLKKLDINLKEKGVQPHDNIVLRVVAQYLDQYLDSKLNSGKQGMTREEVDELKRRNPGHGPKR